jgi:hypothetical protein
MSPGGNETVRTIKNPSESRFCGAFESAFGGLEKHPKKHIYSITCC